MWGRVAFAGAVDHRACGGSMGGDDVGVVG